MKNNLPAAIALAERGFQVFPLHSPHGDECDCRKADCPSPAKHPRTMHGVSDATADIETVNRWWSMWPHANVGVATGKGSNLVVIDVDPRHGGDIQIQQLVEQHGVLPPGPAVMTGGGGWHYYFAYPDVPPLSGETTPIRVPSRNGAIAPGIDVKADGGYVVAPPSVHITGVSYEPCEGWELDAPPMPSWLLQAAIAKQDRRYDGDTGEVPADVAPGKRNDTLTAWGGRLRHYGAPQSVIFAALAALNAEWAQPLDTAEVAQIAASVARYEPEAAIPVVGSGAAADKGKRPRRIEPRTISLREIQQTTYPPPRWAVPGLMPIGLTLLAGRSKMGKSWMMMGVAVAIAEGGIAFGTTPVDDGDVLYLAYEDHERRWQERGTTLLGSGVLWPERLKVAPTGCWPQRDDGGLEAIDAWLGQHPRARLVVVDTLQRFRGADATEGDKNAFAADYKVSGDLQELALKHDVAIAVVHHFRKSLSDVDWVDQINGTNGIAAAADVIWGFVRERGDNQQAALKTTGRDVMEEALALSWDPARLGWYVSGTAEDRELSEAAQEFTDAMYELGQGQPVHYKRIAELVGKQNNTVLKMARRLAAAGRAEIIAVGAGLYQPLPGGRAVTVSPEGGAAPKTNLNGAANPVTGGLSPNVTGGHSGGAVTGGDRPVTGGLSPDSESENGSSDTVTAETENVTDALLRRRGIAASPEQPCPTCGAVNWVARAAGGYVCGDCKPWIEVRR